MPERLDFLASMEIDHPQEASAIKLRVKSWIDQVDEEQGIEGLGAVIVSTMEYVTFEKERQFIQSITHEMAEFLKQNPQKNIMCLLFSERRGSGKFFYDQVMDGLSEEQRKSVKALGWEDIEENSGQNPEKYEYFIVDDSSNSGQQLKMLLGRTNNGALASAADNLRHNSPNGESVNLRIRMMNLTEIVRHEIIDQYINENDNSPYCSITLEGNSVANHHTPTMEDVLYRLGITPSDLKNPDLLMKSHAGRSPTSLLIFPHKVQDNMPICMVQGQRSMISKVSPLIKTEEYVSIGNVYPHNRNLHMLTYKLTQAL